MGSFSRLKEESNRAGVEFLVIELDTAKTFLDIADTTSNEESRMRNRKNAQVAYKTAVNLIPRLTLMTHQKTAVDQRLTVVRHRLKELGFDC